MTIVCTQIYTPRLWLTEFGAPLGGSDRVNLEMRLEAVIVGSWRYTWRPWSSDHRDALRGCNRVSLEMDIQSIIELDWRRTSRWSIWRWSRWRQLMGGVLGAETLLNGELTHNRGNVTRWLYFWRFYGELAGGGRSVVRHARCWSCIEGSTCNSENERTTDNLTYMLYSVYAALGVMLYSVYAALGVKLYSVLTPE